MLQSDPRNGNLDVEIGEDEEEQEAISCGMQILTPDELDLKLRVEKSLSKMTDSISTKFK